MKRKRIQILVKSSDSVKRTVVTGVLVKRISGKFNIFE